MPPMPVKPYSTTPVRLVPALSVLGAAALAAGLCPPARRPRRARACTCRARSRSRDSPAGNYLAAIVAGRRS